MKHLIITATVTLAATGALGQSAAEKTGVNSLVGIPPKTEDFVAEAAMSDMFEIESSKLALERGGEPTKAFAQQMIADHRKTSTELKAMVDSGKVKAALPTAMNPDQQEMIEDLKALKGADFDEQYHDYQDEVHEEAADIFTRYGSEGDNAELKAWAAKTAPALEQHLQMAKDLNK
ncbi:DUF4142 domain-containing protein [Agrobacterium vitis]|uniref:DUF4142 domain-containing protein n=1 Tax=Agrobacterium vitis TaxID=373 RepID=UPI0012E8AEFC|nr:DUF4142 domain-containing protein [Agrobacterium vitis]MVA82533.1 DUF4142 domain-containing protein [Agrobacterium vitis]